jgi:hypothetical protein
MADAKFRIFLLAVPHKVHRLVQNAQYIAATSRFGQGIQALLIILGESDRQHASLLWSPLCGP